MTVRFMNNRIKIFLEERFWLNIRSMLKNMLIENNLKEAKTIILKTKLIVRKSTKLYLDE